jgi:hypothetical protein
MKECINEDSKVSSMRVSLIIITVSICILILILGFNITWNTIHNQSENIHWENMSIFLAGISALLGTTLYGKVKQKNIELTSNV